MESFFHFVQYACKHQWRASDNPSLHGRHIFSNDLKEYLKSSEIFEMENKQFKVIHIGLVHRHKYTKMKTFIFQL